MTKIHLVRKLRSDMKTRITTPDEPADAIDKVLGEKYEENWASNLWRLC